MQKLNLAQLLQSTAPVDLKITDPQTMVSSASSAPSSINFELQRKQMEEELRQFRQQQELQLEKIKFSQMQQLEQLQRSQQN